jgi:tetratricopeptide (TPR) repeat protein
MGDPSGLGQALAYVTGRRFVALPGVFGLDGSRVSSFGLFLWQEFLPVGIALLAFGLASIGRRRPRLLLGLLAWTVPYAVVTILFKIEGQHDCWFVAAWLPLYLAVGVGALEAGSRLGTPAWKAGIAAAALIVGIAWGLNLRDLSQRDYRYAEAYARTMLEPTDPDSILLLAGDDANALVSYQQRVKGERPDVLLVTAPFLYNDPAGFPYDELLRRRHPFLQIPDYAELQRRHPGSEKREIAVAAFLNANAEGRRPLFCERLVPLDFLRPDFTLVPAGVIWKLVRRGPSDALDLKYWKFPVEPEELSGKDRRLRGQKLKVSDTGIDVSPQSYEERLRNVLVMGRFHLAMAMTERGHYLQAGRLCQSILALGQEYGNNAEIVHLTGISFHAAGQEEQAEPALRRSSEISPSAARRATATFYLGEIARKKGREPDAQRLFRQALDTPGLDDATRREIESRLRAP